MSRETSTVSHSTLPADKSEGRGGEEVREEGEGDRKELGGKYWGEEG